MDPSIANPSGSRHWLFAAGATALLLTAGCSQSASRGPWLPPPEGASSLLFTDGAGPPQPIARRSDESDSTAANKTWEVDRTVSGSVNAQGGQIRQRYRASREIGGYTETFTATKSAGGTTYQRTFRDSSRNRNPRQY